MMGMAKNKAQCPRCRGPFAYIGAETTEHVSTPELKAQEFVLMYGAALQAQDKAEQALKKAETDFKTALGEEQPPNITAKQEYRKLPKEVRDKIDELLNDIRSSQSRHVAQARAASHQLGHNATLLKF